MIFKNNEMIVNNTTNNTTNSLTCFNTKRNSFIPFDNDAFHILNNTQFNLKPLFYNNTTNILALF